MTPIDEARFVTWLRAGCKMHSAKLERIETGTHTPGHPDLRLVHTHADLLIEAKVHHGGRIGLEKSQVAWHVRNHMQGKTAFIFALDTRTEILRSWVGTMTNVVALARSSAHTCASLSLPPHSCRSRGDVIQALPRIIRYCAEYAPPRRQHETRA